MQDRRCQGVIGLFIDGLQRYVQSHCPAQGPVLEVHVKVPMLGCADDFVLLG